MAIDLRVECICPTTISWMIDDDSHCRGPASALSGISLPDVTIKVSSIIK